MKKKLFALTLVLVVAVVVCVSCAKKEEPLKEVAVNYTVINNTGKVVTLITLSDTRSDNKAESKPGEGGLPDSESVGIGLPVKVENNAPDVMFGFTVEGGDNLTGHIMQTGGTITLLTKDDGIAFVISDPGK